MLGFPSWIPKRLALYTQLPPFASIWRGFLSRVVRNGFRNAALLLTLSLNPRIALAWSDFSDLLPWFNSFSSPARCTLSTCDLPAKQFPPGFEQQQGMIAGQFKEPVVSIARVLGIGISVLPVSDRWRCKACSAVSNREMYHEELRALQGDAEKNLVSPILPCHARVHAASVVFHKQRYNKHDSRWSGQPVESRLASVPQQERRGSAGRSSAGGKHAAVEESAATPPPLRFVALDRNLCEVEQGNTGDWRT